MFSDDLIQAVKQIDMEIILNEAGVGYNPRTKKWQRPNDPFDKDYSAKIYEDNGYPILHCFGGNAKTYDNIKLYEELYSVSFVEAVKELSMMIGIDYNDKEYKNINTYQKPVEKKDATKQLEYILSKSTPVDKMRKQYGSRNYLDLYFHSRGLRYSLLEDEFKDLNINLYHNYYNKNNFIIYNCKNNEQVEKYFEKETNEFAIKKSIDSYIGRENAENSKINIGSPEISWVLRSDKNNGHINNIIIVEGIEDLLSVALSNKEATIVSLNSTSNTKLFLQDLEKIVEKEKEIKLTFALDNDKTGIETTKELVATINKLYPEITNINKVVFKDEIEQCNDINSALQEWISLGNLNTEFNLEKYVEKYELSLEEIIKSATAEKNNIKKDDKPIIPKYDLFL